MGFAGTQYTRDHKLADHFYLWEMVVSDDYPKAAEKIVLSELDLLAGGFLLNSIIEPTRKFIGQVFRVQSFKRSLQLNAMVGGSSTSQHPWAEAIDFTIPDDNTILLDVMKWIRDNCFYSLGQAILYVDGQDYEPRFLHVSTLPLRSKKKARHKILYCWDGKYNLAPPWA